MGPIQPHHGDKRGKSRFKPKVATLALFRGLKVDYTSVRCSLYGEAAVLVAPTIRIGVSLIFLILGKFEWYVGCLGSASLT